jgi:hypothetical protein
MDLQEILQDYGLLIPTSGAVHLGAAPLSC